jgi:uncharacterized membrane protein YkoI
MAKNQVVMFVVMAIVTAAFAGLFAQYFQAAAQTTNSNNQTASPSVTNQTNAIPQLKGSVSIQNATNDFVKNNAKVSLADAANTAKGQVANGIVIRGGLSEVQGYLTYVFKVGNYDAGTMKMVIVDAGNGKVLYTSNDMPLYNGGIGGGFGCEGGFGHHRHFGGFGYGYNYGTNPSMQNNDNNNRSTTGTTTTLAIPGTSI